MTKTDKVVAFPSALKPNFRMIDVGRKRPTRRVAVACGTLTLHADSFKAVRDGTLPKGNVLALAEAAGIMAAKNTPVLIPLCHTLPLDQASIHTVLNEHDFSITVYAQVSAHAKTGVEMEALCAVQTALLTIWDLTKGIDPDLAIGDIRLLTKTGGKSGVWKNARGIPDWLEVQLPRENFLQGLKAGVLVMSDRASKGTYKDESGPVLVDNLKKAGAVITDYKVIPDDLGTIVSELEEHGKQHKPDVLFASGGTGPGPRDVTPYALAEVCDHMLEGLGDVLRAESLHYTDTAWLSRMTAGMMGPTLVIAFPGSPKAVQECWDIIAPFLGDALAKIKKQGYGAAS